MSCKLINFFAHFVFSFNQANPLLPVHVKDTTKPFVFQGQSLIAIRVEGYSPEEIHQLLELIESLAATIIELARDGGFEQAPDV